MDISRTLVCVLLPLAIASAVVVAGLAVVAMGAVYCLNSPTQSPKRADAIVVLGGNNGDCALFTLEFYRGGYASMIALTGLEEGVATPPAHLVWRVQFLGGRGVPRSAIRLELDARSSYTGLPSFLR
jgi:hypothetical protein